MQLLILLLATLAYPGGVAGDVSDAGLAGAVAGTFIGTLLLCGVLAAVGYWCYVRKRRQNDEQSKQQRPDAETANTSSSECFNLSPLRRLFVSYLFTDLN